MVRSLKKAIGALSVLALIGSTLPTVVAQSVPTTVQIIDNKDVSGFTKEGTWYGENDTGAYNDHYAYAVGGSTNSKAVWTFTNIPSGHYRISATYRWRFNYAKFAEFSVFDGIGSRMKNLGKTTVNMRNAPASFTDANGMKWQDLGTTSYFVVTENTLSVSLAGSSDRVIADAVRIERVGELTGEELLQDFKNSNVTISTDLGEGEEGEPTSVIRVLVLYTDDLLQAQYHGNYAELQTWVNKAFNCSNTATSSDCPTQHGITISVNGIMQASKIPVRFDVAGLVLSPVADVPNNPGQYTNTLSIDPTVNSYRKINDADVVVALTKWTSGANLGATISPGISSGLSLDQLKAETNRESRAAHILNSNFSAFSVIRIYDKIAGVMTIAHEIAHMLGMDHEIQTAPFSIEANSHAYILNGKFKTLDASDAFEGISGICPLGCTLVPLFSTPRVQITLNGVSYPVGSSTADNVSTMTKMAPIVASYSERSSMSVIGLYNPENCLDKNGDGLVSPIDPLLVINYLNLGLETNTFVMTNMRTVLANYGFLDTDKDGFISPIDSLRIFNHLNNPNDPQFSPATVCPH